MKDRSNMLSGRRLTSLMAFVLVVVGISELYINYRNPYSYEMYNAMDCLGYSLMICLGIVLLAGSDRMNVVQKIGYTGLVLGIALFMDRMISVYLVFINRHEYTAFTMLYYYIQFVLSVLLIYFSVCYLRGNNRAGFRMALTTAMSALTVLYYMLFAIINKQIPLDYYVDLYLPDTVALGMYIVFVMTIFTPGAYTAGSVSRLRGTIDDLVKHSTTSPDSTVLRADILDLGRALENESLWSDARDGTPFKEYRLRVGAQKDSAKILLFRRYRSDRTRVIVTNLAVSEHVQSTCFDFLCMVPVGGDSLDDCPMVRIFGKDGFFADILVEADADSYQPDITDKLLEMEAGVKAKAAEWKKKIWQ